MKRVALMLFVVLCLIPCYASAGFVLVDVPQLVGKTEAEVTKILGKPVSCEKSKYGQKCTYSKNEIEIVFIKGKADWITINNVGEITCSK